VADALSKLVTLSPNGTGKIKIFDISPNGRQQRECTSSEMIANLREPAELYAEVCIRISEPFHKEMLTSRTPDCQEIPAEELRVSDNEKIIDVFHYHKDPSRWHGVPFRFAIRAVSHSVRFPQ
jgi:ubiquitin carboxyl-terminal hydrolase 7